MGYRLQEASQVKTAAKKISQGPRGGKAQGGGRWGLGPPSAAGKGEQRGTPNQKLNLKEERGGRGNYTATSYAACRGKKRLFTANKHH